MGRGARVFGVAPPLVLLLGLPCGCKRSVNFKQERRASGTDVEGEKTGPRPLVKLNSTLSVSARVELQLDTPLVENAVAYFRSAALHASCLRPRAPAALASGREQQLRRFSSGTHPTLPRQVRGKGGPGAG